MKLYIIDYLDEHGHTQRAVAHGHTKLTADERAKVVSRLDKNHRKIVGHRTITSNTPGELIAALARTYNGQHEIAGKNRGPLPDRVLADSGWHFKPDEKGQPWCMAFAGYIAKHAGYPIPGGSTASCYLARIHAEQAHRFSTTPQIGAIGILHGDKHAVIVLAIRGDRVLTIAGNTSAADGTNYDGGTVAVHEYDLAALSGYILPPKG